MASWGKIARRTFLVGSVAVAGGVAFGVWKIRQPVANPLNPPDGVALNPFLILDRTGVTLVLGRAEMGQGAQTTLAAMLAVAAPALPRYRSRVAVLALAGALAAVSTNGDNLIWRFYSPQYTAGQAAYTLVGAPLGGLILGAIVRPQAAKTADA